MSAPKRLVVNADDFGFTSDVNAGILEAFERGIVRSTTLMANGAAFAAQGRRILDAGLRPTHLDTHKHTHLWPPVLEAVCRIAQEFQIPWVRKPLLFRPRGCRTTDHFTGFALTGRLDTAALLRFIRKLPPGTTEFMCHPGRCGSELRAAPTPASRPPASANSMPSPPRRSERLWKPPRCNW